ncbi:MAG: imidazoleglycerol-phosphate dehydratase HisB [Spirochaetaceae bacterium]|nr:MAG: imidazoleglycerol-phosphate dehydratase HisB [Spirochaetaceae bacterium]
MERTASQSRKTAETDIQLSIDLSQRVGSTIDTELPFFNHMLTSMAFHGGFLLNVTARGDIDVDPHHLVEDTGLVLGDAFAEILCGGGLTRFADAMVPMDDALAEAVIDAGGRPYLVYVADFPQTHAGTFDLSLVREFFYAFAVRARCNVHLHARYGENGHHMVEAMFKAFGIALGKAFSPRGDDAMSTKGVV